MVPRYSREEISKLWTLEAKFRAWLRVELSVVKAWNQLGVIDEKTKDAIIKKADFTIEEIDAVEKEVKHDVIAFNTVVARYIDKNSDAKEPKSRFFHYGITSSDIIDTANALLIKESLEIILQDLEKLEVVLKNLAIEHKFTPIIGRSHGIHGEITTFGLSILNFYSEIKRQKAGLEMAKQYISVGKISGAMGNMPHTSIELEELVCKDLGLKSANVSNQIIQRDRYARVFSELALLASSCEKIVVNIRHLQRTEVYEVEEYFSTNQKGSSAMPHKRNPVLSENITGLCRVIRGFVVPALEDVALWHERDISHSSVERFILPDGLITTDFMLDRLTSLLANLKVYDKNMLKNINHTCGLVFSQRVLLKLPLLGISREEAYKIVQANAMKVWDKLQGNEKCENDLFLKYLLEDNKLQKIVKDKNINLDEIKECFDIDYYLKNIEAIFKRTLQN